MQHNRSLFACGALFLTVFLVACGVEDEYGESAGAIRGDRGCQLTDLYRYWHPGADDHFYTTNWNELADGHSGWRYEGIAGYICTRPGPGRRALYRYWNPRVNDHFYTIRWGELGRGRNGYRYEGIAGYVYRRGGDGRKKLHRYYNPWARDHFYTIDWSELGAGREGWTYEGHMGFIDG